MRSEYYGKLTYLWCARHIIPIQLDRVNNPLVWQCEISSMYNGFRRWLNRNKIMKVCSNKEFEEHLDHLFPDKEKQNEIYYGMRHFTHGITQEDELFLLKSIIWDSNSQMMIAAS